KGIKNLLRLWISNARHIEEAQSPKFVPGSRSRPPPSTACGDQHIEDGMILLSDNPDAVGASKSTEVVVPIGSPVRIETPYRIVCFVAADHRLPDLEIGVDPFAANAWLPALAHEPRAASAARGARSRNRGRGYFLGMVSVGAPSVVLPSRLLSP